MWYGYWLKACERCKRVDGLELMAFTHLAISGARAKNRNDKLCDPLGGRSGICEVRTIVAYLVNK